MFFQPTPEPEVVVTASPEPSKRPELVQVDYLYKDAYGDFCLRVCLKAEFKVDYLQLQDDDEVRKWVGGLRGPKWVVCK